MIPEAAPNKATLCFSNPAITCCWKTATNYYWSEVLYNEKPYYDRFTCSCSGVFGLWSGLQGQRVGHGNAGRRRPGVYAIDDPAGTPLSKTFDIDALGTYYEGVFYTESEVDSLLSGKEDAASNDIDPDRLNGDTSDDNLIDEGIISADITRDSEAAAAYEAIDSNDFDPDRIAGDTTDDNLLDEAAIDADITRDSEAAAAYQPIDADLTDLADGDSEQV